MGFRGGTMARGNGPAARRPGGRLGPVVLSAGLLGLWSCSGRPDVGPPDGADAKAEPGYFVDSDYLGGLCVASRVAYPIVTEERTIDGANPSEADASIVRMYREAFADALANYPRKLLGEVGLKEVVLCRGLSVDGTACFAFSDVEHGRLFLNLDAGRPDGFTKRTLHHEFFHFVDFAEDGRLDEDRSWSALNPSGFEYGSGGGSMQQDSGAGRPDESLVGFVNRYSTSGLAEDKAEVYACLAFDAPWMARRASSDPILGRKVGLIRASLRRIGPLTSGLLPSPR